MKQAFLNGATLIVALAFAGCAQTYNFRVDALADPEVSVSEGRFTLENGFSDSPGSSLRFRETADYVGRALRARGYEPAEDAEEADFIVTVSAAISEPLNETERRLEPMYYRNWGRTDIIRTPIVDGEGNVTYIRTHIYTPPDTRFAGYRGTDRSVVVYEKQLELTASTPEGEEMWTVIVEAVDRTADLRSYIPYLAAAAMPYLGERTEGSVVVRIKEDDETVEYLRGMRARQSGGE